MLFVDKVSKLEETMLHLKENNAELFKLVKAQRNANDTIRNKICALIEKVACLCNEIIMPTKLERLMKNLTNFFGLGKSESGAY